MAKLPTRAEVYGVKPGALAARSKRLVSKARAAIAELSAAWDDNCQGVILDAEQILVAIDQLPAAIDEGVSYLREPWGGADA